MGEQTRLSEVARPRRSALYLPASNARAIAKARTLDCDVVILDLEDAVAPEAKALAREQAAAAARDGGFGARELVVRVNAIDSEWGADDLATLAGLPIDAVLVPKVDAGRDIVACTDALADVPVWAMIETARAMLRLEDIAAAPGLAALVMGTNDLAKEMRATPGADRLPLHVMLAMTVAAARAFGLTALDGVHNAIEDHDGFATECAQGARFGFDGKTLIHPSQIDPCNAAFGPTSDDITQAERIVAAFDRPENAAKGAIRLDGAMVERLHLDSARRTLAIAEAIRRR
jgi:citrate lyase subunit beta/citryl-CoA lyase